MTDKAARRIGCIVQTSGKPKLGEAKGTSSGEGQVRLYACAAAICCISIPAKHGDRKIGGPRGSPIRVQPN
jgi:hypothetical protein